MDTEATTPTPDEPGAETPAPGADTNRGSLAFITIRELKDTPKPALQLQVAYGADAKEVHDMVTTGVKEFLRAATKISEFYDDDLND